MNRRRFLSLLAGAGAASATSYFLPPICGWKSDVIAQPDVLQIGEDRFIGTVDSTEAEWRSGMPMQLYGIPYYYNASTTGEYLGIARSAFYVEEVSLPVSDLRKMYPNRMEQGNMLNRAMSTLQRYWDGERKRLVAS